MTNYIDLGLPSGTLWAAMNVGAKSIVDDGDYFTHKEAMECDITLPTQEQFQELVDNTTYKWVKNYNNCGVNGGLFIGINGNEVFFPAGGNRINGRVYGQDSFAYYWSSTIVHNKSYAYTLEFTNCGDVWQYGSHRDHAFMLRVVKNK